MSINRRKFIRTAGGFALATVTGAIPSLGSWKESGSSDRKLRVAVFHDPGFPTVDFAPIPKETLKKALDGYDVSFLSAAEVAAGLSVGTHDVFLNPFGSAFPKGVFVTISKFLTEGGNFVNLGGIPFSVPVDEEGSGWRKEVRQTTHHKKFGITQAFPIPAQAINSYIPDERIDGAKELSKEFTAEEIYELYVRFASTKDFPAEDGSAGERDAVLRPVVVGIGSEKRRLAAPFIQMDWLQGDCTGGRWMLANFKGTITAKAIRTLVEIATLGALQLNVRSSFACYHEGELPSFTIQFRCPKSNAQSIIDDNCRIEILDGHQKSIAALNVKLIGEGSLATGYVDLPEKTESLAPGLYRVNAKLRLKSPTADRSTTMRCTTGFWVFDKALLAGGKPLTLDRNYFLRDGLPYPVTGTTYMASDVHRKFLFEPNPYIWNEDFSEMKNAGINMVRTGVWTGWKNYMLDAGAPNESALRGLDAFILTARKHDIPLIFTLFAFLPETWGGANAYLDPRSLNAQKEFIAAIAQRYGAVNDIIWDLINEPSFCNPQHLWSCRPNYDAYESAAWNTWLQGRIHSASNDERLARLQEEYRAAAGESIALPSLEDFDNVSIFDERRPIKVADYKLFAQEMFANWVKEVKSAIRDNGNPHQLITVGQDEAGTGDSPGPQFFGDAVDFTCIHNWWLNDDLVWDNVVTKTPDKPNLVEETGVMFYEKMDGSAWRTEEEARNLLERKLAISIGAGGAGFLEWIWNTNPYMQSDNEAAIGLYRVDGTAKPELGPVVDFARFFAANKHLMVGRKDEDVLMILPHSQQFSPRNYASEATKRCVRVMYYHLGMPVASVSEYRPDKIRSAPKLIVLPSPRTLNDSAWEKILSSVERGSTLLITGIVDTDDHWLPVQRLKQFGVAPDSKPVAEEEFLMIDGHEYQVSYRGDKIQRIEKAVVDEDDPQEVMTIPHGKGMIFWSPLPVEVSESVEPTVALYEYALKGAQLSPVFSLEKKDPSVLVLPTVFNDSILYTFVSESDRDEEVHVLDKETKTAFTAEVPAQRTALVFLSRKDGTILAKLG